MICEMQSPFTGREIHEVPTDLLTAWLTRIDERIAKGHVYREHQAATIAEVRRVLAERQVPRGSKPKENTQYE